MSPEQQNDRAMALIGLTALAATKGASDPVGLAKRSMRAFHDQPVNDDSLRDMIRFMDEEVERTKDSWQVPRQG